MKKENKKLKTVLLELGDTLSQETFQEIERIYFTEQDGEDEATITIDYIYNDNCVGEQEQVDITLKDIFDYIKNEKIVMFYDKYTTKAIKQYIKEMEEE